LKWKVYPTPLREGKGRVLKEKSWRMSVDHWFLDPFVFGEVLCFTFTFSFPQ
jgi:hypothetical protein